MRLAALLATGALGALAACETAPGPESRMPVALHLVAENEAPEVRAVFDAYPEKLFDAATLACNGPGQNTVRPTRDSLRCESLPQPGDAAMLILQFEGTVEDLPRYVISFDGTDSGEGYVVAADSYIRVPAQSGGERLVKVGDSGSGGLLADVLRAAGGRPI